MTFKAILTNLYFDGTPCGHRHKTPEAAESCGRKLLKVESYAEFYGGEADAVIVISCPETTAFTILYPGETLASKYPTLKMTDWEVEDKVVEP